MKNRIPFSDFGKYLKTMYAVGGTIISVSIFGQFLGAFWLLEPEIVSLVAGVIIAVAAICGLLECTLRLLTVRGANERLDSMWLMSHWGLVFVASVATIWPSWWTFAGLLISVWVVSRFVRRHRLSTDYGPGQEKALFPAAFGLFLAASSVTSIPYLGWQLLLLTGFLLVASAVVAVAILESKRFAGYDAQSQPQPAQALDIVS
ncbi:hypothetical protein KKD81_01125 [Patescibacteria group bacterium]|nr:hypothetical protein [Patescibacteria group bacterium]MBU2159090.1 hypothetical protein [Patescibacteria group bacterium]MBU2220519.1 hypothetical protein [Patescibacteria group bacterium]